MGLNITAVGRAELTAVSLDEYEASLDLYKTHRPIWDAYTFPERMDGLQPGVYRHGARLDFEAGSYGGYGMWRDQLSWLALNRPAIAVQNHPGAYEEAPFYALIYMSDCEGYIGPQTAALLVYDFARFADHAAAVRDTWFREKYQAWQAACILAADGGFIQFH